jgi:hypothetical protein
VLTQLVGEPGQRGTDLLAGDDLRLKPRLVSLSDASPTRKYRVEAAVCLRERVLGLELGTNAMAALDELDIRALLAAE